MQRRIERREGSKMDAFLFWATMITFLLASLLPLCVSYKSATYALVLGFFSSLGFIIARGAYVIVRVILSVEHKLKPFLFLLLLLLHGNRSPLSIFKSPFNNFTSCALKSKLYGMLNIKGQYQFGGLLYNGNSPSC